VAHSRTDTAGLLLPLSRDLHRLTARCAEPAWNMAEAERRIAEGERIAAAVRRIFRG